MGITVLNLLGEPAAAAARSSVPDAEVLTYAADAVPDDVRAEVMFSAFAPLPLHDRLDEIGVRWMHIPGTGVDNWPRELLAARVVTCSRGVSAVPIAEYCLAAMLAFEKDIPRIFLDEVPAHWNFHDPMGELAGKTVAIIGLGGIGEAVAKRALAFDCRVRALRRRPEQGAPPGVELASDLSDLLASADHLVIAAPATSATEHLLDDEAFSVIKPGVHIVNIARGSLIDQDALRGALDDGRVALATLDTVTPEPLPEGHWLYAHPKVRVSAHISWGSPHAFPRIMQAFADNLARYVAGEPLVGVVDPAEGYLMVIDRADGPGAVVVGTGFGCRVHVPALRAAGFHVVGLVGTDPERTARRAERAAVPHAFTDLSEALARDDVVAVTVATPPHTHASLVIAAAEAGRHVICEKPFALDAVQAQAMLDAAEAAGVMHLVGHEFRWAPERAVAARALAGGAVGEPRFAAFVSYGPLVADPDAKVPGWWFDAESGGGWLGASGSHVVDQIRTWLGEFAAVSATTSVVSDRQGVAEDSFTVRFRLRSGVDGVLQQTAAAWGPYSGITKVAGTGGSLWTEGDAVWVADRDGSRVLPVPDDLVPPPAPEASGDPRHKFTHLELGPYTRLCEVLLGGIEGRAHHTPVAVPTFADGVACMEVLDAIRASAGADGAVVPLG